MNSLIAPLRVILLMLTAALLAVTVLSLGASAFWPLDLLTHFRVQYLVLAAVAAGVGSVLRAPVSTGLALVTLSANLVFAYSDIVPELSAPKVQDGSRDGSDARSADSVRIAVANVLTSNRDGLSLSRWIAKEEPDIIGLLEVNDRWTKELRYLRGRYPHSIVRPREDNFGLAIYSKLPFLESDAVALGAFEIEAIRVEIEISERRVGVLLAHPVPPVGRRYAEVRNHQLAEVSRIRRESAGLDFVVLGDLNSSPWSPHFRRLTRSAELRSAARGFGFMPTWPTALGPMMIPLDHMLVSPAIGVESFARGPEIGSDHRPIIATLRLSGEAFDSPVR